MAADMSNNPDALPAGRAGGPPFSGKTVAVLLLVLAIVAGFSAGVALDRVVLLPHAFHGRGGPGGPGHRGPDGPPDGGREGARERFSRALNLTPPQQTRIDSIMSAQRRTLGALRQRVQPAVDSVFAQTRTRIDSVLTPAQRQIAERIRREHPAPGMRALGGPWGHGDDNRPPGPPPADDGRGPPERRP